MCVCALPPGARTQSNDAIKACSSAPVRFPMRLLAMKRGEESGSANSSSVVAAGRLAALTMKTRVACAYFMTVICTCPAPPPHIHTHTLHAHHTSTPRAICAAAVARLLGNMRHARRARGYQREYHREYHKVKEAITKTRLGECIQRLSNKTTRKAPNRGGGRGGPWMAYSWARARRTRANITVSKQLAPRPTSTNGVMNRMDTTHVATNPPRAFDAVRDSPPPLPPLLLPRIFWVNMWESGLALVGAKEQACDIKAVAPRPPRPPP